MTSVSQPTQIPSQASNTVSATQSAQSYASATKKAVSSPLVATSSSTSSPALAVGGSAPVQHAKSSSISPVNGRAAITPAVPAVNTTPAIANSNPTNGSSADHSRKSSVNFSTNGGYIPNGGPVGGQKPGIQFGSITDSPAASHSTPQAPHSTASAPISIPGNPRVTSPAQSPSPIPQPAASGGGRPPTGLQSNGMTFGSLGGDGERHMRQSSGSQGNLAPGAPPPHVRRESSGEIGHQGPGTPNRGGFAQPGGRGRGSFNGNYQQQQMGYSAQAPSFRGAPAQGRGGMPPQFQGQGRPMSQYPNSPHQAARSPALANSIPGTPNMGQAMPMPAAQQQYGYGPQFHMQGPPQVTHPSSSTSPSISFQSGRGRGKRNGQQRGRSGQQSFGQREQPREVFGHALSSNGMVSIERSQRNPSSDQTFMHPLHSQFPPPDLCPLPFGPSKIDFSPESGNFDKYLTSRQNYGGYGSPPFDRMTGMPMAAPIYGYPQMQYMQSMQGPPQSPQTTYQQPYNVGQYSNPAQPQPMSRTSSQISERPNSSLGQPQVATSVPSTSSTPQPRAASTSSAFQKPTRKSAALVIKRPDGEVIDLPTVKAPASPAPSNRSRTPDVVASTPTPPPKSSTPLHTRTDSSALKSQDQKSQEQKILEFKEQMRKAAEAETKNSDGATDPKPAAEAEAQRENKTPEASPSAEDIKAAEDAAAAKAAADAQAAEDARAKEEAAKVAFAAEQKLKEDEELERQIAEMEAAEAKREKEEAELLAKRAAEKEAADKLNAEKNKALAAENDRKLREQEREMERLEDEREQKRLAAEAKAVGKEAPIEAKKDTVTPDVKDDTAAVAKDAAEVAKDVPATPSTLASKFSNLTLGTESGASTPASDDSMGPPAKVPGGEKRAKPTALNLAPLNTKPVEPPQPSAALQSLKSARFLTAINSSLYPPSINSPNPALNSAVTTKGKSFKYDKEFLLQFQKVFIEKPSMEFESQVKALIGDSEPGSARAGSTRTPGGMGPRQGSNRNQSSGSFPMPMGTFGAGGKTLPPGTSSAERFAMSQGTLPRPAMNPMTSFSRPGGAFPGPVSMQRVPSNHMGSAGPNTPRNASNRNTRNSSKRVNDSKQELVANKTMPLTANMDLKPIQVSATGWKPRSIGAPSATGAAGPPPGASGAGGHMEPDMVQRKVKAALNKMTPEKFDKIADQILTIAAQSKDEADGRTLRQVIQLTFEKATDEAHWASMYAKFCKRMLETMSSDIKDESILDKNGNVVSGGNLFRKYLLNRCQEEFERGWKMDLGEKPEGEEGDEPKSEEAAMLSDAYYVAAAAKRRGLGLVQFIGELYKLGMLTERIMHECVKKLVDYTGIPDEAEIESLTKLLKTIGGNLDSTEKGRPMMDVYFTRIQSMVDTPDLPSRLRFMLMDIIDLRRAKWHSKEDNKGPKTLEEVRAEAEAAAAQKAAENARGSQRGGGGGGRMQMGRGDSRNFSNQYGSQPPIDYTKNTVATDDLRRLGKSGSNRNQGPMSFGPTSMFSSRSSSGRKLGPGGSLSRAGEDSGASSRAGTPPQKDKEPATSVNAFSLLSVDDGEPEHPTSPPSTAASPAISKAALTSGAKEGGS
ncbi:MAG: hypothetical protein M1818_007552 [Claussenomyces sp. TS43310]|nr:MAG: hypothetical protein M1818_007552 [Claussenomyces sp. TS43310]